MISHAIIFQLIFYVLKINIGIKSAQILSFAGLVVDHRDTLYKLLTRDQMMNKLDRALIQNGYKKVINT